MNIRRSIISKKYCDLHLILGPMFSGKTSSLISNLTKYTDVGIPCLYINSSFDIRDTHFSTHNSSLSSISPKIILKKVSTLNEIDIKLIDQVDVIAIDESQFFTDLLENTIKWLHKCKIIFVAGLDADISQNPFGDILKLIPYASKIKKLLSICDLCKSNGELTLAPFSSRKTNSNEKILIGGSDLYYPLCYYHQFQK
jgi:thymidine kinase